jgi:hypothetical protein
VNVAQAGPEEQIVWEDHLDELRELLQASEKANPTKAPLSAEFPIRSSEDVAWYQSWMGLGEDTPMSSIPPRVAVSGVLRPLGIPSKTKVHVTSANVGVLLDALLPETHQKIERKSLALGGPVKLVIAQSNSTIVPPTQLGDGVQAVGRRDWTKLSLADVQAAADRNDAAAQFELYRRSSLGDNGATSKLDLLLKAASSKYPPAVLEFRLAMQYKMMYDKGIEKRKEALRGYNIAPTTSNTSRHSSNMAFSSNAESPTFCGKMRLRA